MLDFVPQEQIDPIAYRRSYYLGPTDGAEKVYALLVRAMEESGLSARTVRKKHRGEDAHAKAPEEEEEAAPDLMKALRASVDSAKKRGNGRSPKRRPTRRKTRSRS